jgi:DNA-binding NtrC family response regulator
MVSFAPNRGGLVPINWRRPELADVTAPCLRFSMPIASILVVDDEEDVRDVLQGILEGADYRVSTAADGNEASKLLAAEKFSLVLTDLLMPDRDGIEVVGELRKKYPTTPVIVMSGGGRMRHVEYLKMAKTFGAHAVLEKPFKSEQLLTTITQLLAKKPAEKRSGSRPPIGGSVSK